MSSDKAPFPPPKRYITTHNSSGVATFSSAVPAVPETHSIPGMLYHDIYTSFSSPINIQDDADLAALKANEPNESTISFPEPGNVVLRYCDWPPGGEAPLHRHESVDFGIVIFGSVEAVMEDGEKRVLGPGDVLVQRGTLHGWKNVSEKEWARVAFVIMGCRPVEVGGEVKGLDLGRFA